MKLKHALILLGIAYCFEFIGAWMKLTHQRLADSALLITTIMKVVAVIIIVIKIVTHPKLKEFLNR